MNQFGSNHYQFNNSLSNYYTQSYNQTEEMDNNFWCHDVPDNMPEAFNVTQNQLNTSDQSLFRFSGNTSSSNLNCTFPTNNSNFNLNNEAKQSSIYNNNNWKTINNLSTASNSIAPFKRKNQLEDDDLLNFQPTNKQKATEERVLGKLNKLSIDEEFEFFDADEFILALDHDEEFVEEDLSMNKDELLETDEIIDKEIEFELADDVKDYWSRNQDVITKLVNEQRDRNSKALVLWQPRISLINQDDNQDNKDNNKDDNTKKEITDNYTVIEEQEDLNLDDNTLEIIELDDKEINDDLMDI